MANEGIRRQAAAPGEPGWVEPLSPDELEYPAVPDGGNFIRHPACTKFAAEAVGFLQLHCCDRGLSGWISGKCFLYYEQGNPAARFCADVSVVLDSRWRPGPEGGNLVWRAGKAPDFVMNVTMAAGRQGGSDDNRAVCERIGVREYLLATLDPGSRGPDAERPAARLLLLRLGGDGRYAEVAPDAGGELFSESLDVAFRVKGKRLFVRAGRTGEVYPTYLEQWRTWNKLRRVTGAAEAEAAEAKRRRRAAEAEAAEAKRGRLAAEARLAEIRRAGRSTQVVFREMDTHYDWLYSDGKLGSRLGMSGRDLRFLAVAGWNLRRSDFSKSNLRGADLRGTGLREADLRGADLREADLREARLAGADLRAADLTGARVRQADLRGARTEGARGLPLLHRLSRSAAPPATVAGAVSTSLQAPCGPSPDDPQERL